MSFKIEKLCSNFSASCKLVWWVEDEQPFTIDFDVNKEWCLGGEEEDDDDADEASGGKWEEIILRSDWEIFKLWIMLISK